MFPLVNTTSKARRLSAGQSRFVAFSKFGGVGQLLQTYNVDSRETRSALQVVAWTSVRNQRAEQQIEKSHSQLDVNS